MPVLRRQPRRPSCLERFAQENGGRFAAASGGILLLAAVDQAVEKGAGGDDDGLGADGAAVAELDAEDCCGSLRSQLSVVGSLVVGHRFAAELCPVRQPRAGRLTTGDCRPPQSDPRLRPA